MLDAWIIEELNRQRKERRQEEDRPRLYLPVPEYLPPSPSRKNGEDNAEPSGRVEIPLYNEDEPKNTFEVNFEVEYFKF